MIDKKTIQITLLLITSLISLWAFTTIAGIIYSILFSTIDSYSKGQLMILSIFPIISLLFFGILSYFLYKKIKIAGLMFSASDQLIECVPNFSEGRNQQTIDAIADAIKSVANVKLMNIDVGIDANRTVYTFAGKPQAVLEAAYQAIKTAGERIDMRVHKGEHPRMGACDVCPLIPLQNITMDEVVEFSKQLGKRIASLGIPVYLYEYSATTLLRKNLAYLRKGEYEAIAEKIKSAEWKPDFGKQQFNPKFGMMALGARKFLIAYNINLKTKDESIAKEIAKKIREIRTTKMMALIYPIYSNM
jgi:glutamate formiminotransferase